MVAEDHREQGVGARLRLPEIVRGGAAANDRCPGQEAAEPGPRQVAPGERGAPQLPTIGSSRPPGSTSMRPVTTAIPGHRSSTSAAPARLPGSHHVSSSQKAT